MTAERHMTDRLAEVRYWKSQLELLENHLVERITADPSMLKGAPLQARIVTRQRRHLCYDRLPAHMLADPAIWKQTDEVDVVISGWNPTPDSGAVGTRPTPRQEPRAARTNVPPSGPSKSATWFSVAPDEFHWISDAG